MSAGDNEKLHATTGDIVGPPRNNPDSVVLDPASFSVRVIVRVIVVTLLLLFIGGFILTIVNALTYLIFLLILSVFLAYLIAPLVRVILLPFESGGLSRLMPRPLAIAIAYLGVFSLLGLAIASLAPAVVEQGKEFGANIPSYANSIRRSINDLDRGYDRLRIPEELQRRINDQVTFMGERVTATFGNFIFNLVLYLPWLIIVPILSFFFLKDVAVIRAAFLQMFPPGRWRSRAESIIQDVNETLAAYTRAQLISCFLIGTICTVGFYFMGLRYALLLGILAGIFEFVPLLGPLSIGIIATATGAFGDDPWRGLYTAIFLIVLRVFHDYVSYPRIVRGGIHLHPLLIILSVIAGEQVAGIPGVFLAIPVVAIFTVVYRHVLEHQGRAGLFSQKQETEPVAEGDKEPTA
ncbi:MAG: AI-2E family transporter [Blastocatellia bacterium]|nr:AI-2E family transporter [Blastocatellia bacterium]